MRKEILESKYKEGKVIKTFSSFSEYIKESDGYENQTRDYDATEVKRKINRVILWLSINKGFYGELLTHLNIYGSSEVPTMCTNGTDIIFGPKFVLEHTEAELRFVLAHEILHCIGDHMARRGNRDHEGFNIAADYAINPLLMDEEGMDFPKWPDGTRKGLYDERFVGMTAETIYDILTEEKEMDKLKKDPNVKKIVKESGEVIDQGEKAPKPDEDLVIQDVNMEEDGSESDEYPEGDEWDESEGGDEGQEGEGQEGEGQEGEGQEGAQGDGEENKKGPPMNPEVGMYVRKNNGGYGKVSSVNADGTYDIEEVTEEEVKKALNY